LRPALALHARPALPPADDDVDDAPTNQTWHQLDGRSFLVMSWTARAFGSLSGLDRDIIERAGCREAPNGTRHLLMRAM